MKKLARYLSVYDYGVYSSYVNIAAYMLMLANLNFNEYILVSSKNNIKELKLKQSLFLVYAIFIVVIGAILAVFLSFEQKWLFILIFFKTFFDGTFFSLILPFFQATRKFKEISIINILYSIGIILITMVVYYYKLSLYMFVTLSVLLGVINFIHCSVYSKINYWFAIKHLKKFLKYIDKTLKYFAGVSVVMFTQARLYILCISIFLAKKEAALFFAAYNIYTITQLFVEAQIQQFMPEMVNLEGKELTCCVKKGINLLFSFFGILFIFFIFFGKNLLHIIYGKEYYLNAFPILILLSAISLLNVGGIFGCAISAKGMQKEKMKMQIEFLVITVISLLFLSKIGLYGFIITYAITIFYTLIRYYIFYRRRLCQRK